MKGTALFACLLMLLGLSGNAGGAQEQEGRRRFLVKEISGTVIAWPPLAPAWVELKKGDPIWEDTLIQVQRDAMITFELSAKDGFKGMQAESMLITLNTPILMRLRENIPRRLSLNDYFIPKIPDLKPKKDVSALVFESLAEAWERLAANVLPQEIKAKFFNDAANVDRDAATVSLRAKKIRFYTPSAGALAITQNLPEEIRISWKAVSEPNANYGIRLWQPDKPRPEPMVFTKQDYYSVKIAKEGNYLVQIATEDGRWQSEVRQFSVLLPMGGRGEPPSLTHINLPLPLHLPPKNFVFYAKELPTSLTFEWERPNAAEGRQTYTFVLSDAQGKELYKRELSDFVFNLKFTNPGTYRWFVVASPAFGEAGGPNQIFSEVRTVSVQKPPTPEEGKPDPLEELFLVRADRLFYLENLW